MTILDLEALRTALRRLRPDQLRAILAEFAPGDGTEKDLAEIQFGLATDRLEFLRQLEFPQNKEDGAVDDTVPSQLMN